MRYYRTEQNMVTFSGIIVAMLAVSHYVNGQDAIEYKSQSFRCSRPSTVYTGSHNDNTITPISTADINQETTISPISNESTSGLSTQSVYLLTGPSLNPCPSNMVYMNCTRNWNRSCQNPNGIITDNNNCTEPGGCVCPDGFMMKGIGCVIPEECGCFVSSRNILTENDVYINDNCTERCVCNNFGEFTCDYNYICNGNATCDVREGKRQCYCTDGFAGDGENCTPIDCHQILLAGHTQDGVYNIQPLNWSGLPFEVYCNMTINGGGWTVFQRRVNGSIGFYRDWNEYKYGFGVLDHEFWLGNEKLFYLTNQKDYELRIDMVNSLLAPYYAHYTLFRLSNETMNYKLSTLGSYSGTAGFDAMTWHRNMNFSTYDHDRDTGASRNCAVDFTGAWWYRACHQSNLNGDYHGTAQESVRWDRLTGNQFGIKYTEMKIRPL